MPRWLSEHRDVINSSNLSEVVPCARSNAAHSLGRRDCPQIDSALNDGAKRCWKSIDRSIGERSWNKILRVRGYAVRGNATSLEPLDLCIQLARVGMDSLSDGHEFPGFSIVCGAKSRKLLLSTKTFVVTLTRSGGTLA